jgi:hypothetical protein
MNTIPYKDLGCYEKEKLLNIKIRDGKCNVAIC